MRERFISASANGIRALSVIIGAIAILYPLIASRLVPFTSQRNALLRNPFWFEMHVAFAGVAMIAGIFQFLPKLRSRKLQLHRVTGYIYVASVVFAAIAALRLTPDLPNFVADGVRDQIRLGLVRPTITIPGPDKFVLIQVSFVLLGLSWLATTAMALRRVLQGNYDSHREWMIRSYSLTFAAVTVRLVASLLLLVHVYGVLGADIAIQSWIVNFIVAEWYTRTSRLGSAPPLARAASSASA